MTNEYQEMKKELLRRSYTKFDVNNAINDANDRAYNQLSPQDKEMIDKHKACLFEKFKGMGDKSALELLAAIGNVKGIAKERK
jgi:hypothetical protein